MCKNQNKYLFLLGNGASIASANPEWDHQLKFKPSIKNIIPIFEEMNVLNKESPFELLDLIDEDHFEALKGLINKVIGISKRRGERDIVKLLKSMEEDSAKNWSQRNDLGLQERTDQSMPIWTDISTLENAIYHLVAAYYRNIEEKYFGKLWRLAQDDNSPVISLNWDINFERVIQEKNPSIPMANYYGEYIFNLLPSDQKKGPHFPLVNILKPHGSLNWLIPTGAQASFGDLKENSCQLQAGSHLRIMDNLPTNINSEYQCFLIPPVPDKSAIERYSGLFWKIKESIWKDISGKIKKYAMNPQTLVVIGYSFPPEDEHIKNLFIKNRFKNVWVFDTNKDVYERIKGYFPDAMSEFKEGGFAEIMNWPDVGEGFKPSRSE